jgi:hypothetical protein
MPVFSIRWYHQKLSFPALNHVFEKNHLFKWFFLEKNGEKTLKILKFIKKKVIFKLKNWKTFAPFGVKWTKR